MQIKHSRISQIFCTCAAKCTAVMKRENVKFPFGQPFSSPTFITFLLIISSAAPTKTFGGADADADAFLAGSRTALHSKPYTQQKNGRVSPSVFSFLDLDNQQAELRIFIGCDSNVRAQRRFIPCVLQKSPQSVQTAHAVRNPEIICASVFFHQTCPFQRRRLAAANRYIAKAITGCKQIIRQSNRQFCRRVFLRRM